MLLESWAIPLVLFAALLHASWNALTKSSGDRLVYIAIVTGTGGLLAAPLLFWVPAPPVNTVPWLAASLFLHFTYQLALVRAYEVGDLSQIYPIARGLAPIGVASLAAVFAGESLHLTSMFGLALSSVAIIVLAGFGAKKASPATAVPMAVLTAALIGAYTYVDGRGVRTVEFAGTYIVWSFFLDSIVIVAVALFMRRKTIGASLRATGWSAVGGGIMATASYGIVLWAMRGAQMASVASLRESSVLFAAILGTRLLGEPFGRRRVWAALALVAGLVMVQVGAQFGVEAGSP